MSPIPVKAGISYSEGYICPNVYLPDCETQLPNESQIKDTLKGFCAGLGIGAGFGTTIVGCSKGAALIYSIGFYVPFAGPLGGYADFYHQYPSLGWDWAVQERLNGYYLEGIR